MKTEEILSLSKECVHKIVSILEPKHLTLKDADQIMDAIIVFFITNSVANLSCDRQREYLQERLMCLSENLFKGIIEVHSIHCSTCNDHSNETIH